MLRSEIGIYSTGCVWDRGDIITFYPHTKSHIVLKCVPDKVLIIAANNLFTRLMMKARLW
ncbi:hypothetical protein PCURB6_27200 [Paenibacillus curdlanolyticus]|nr:hypothetical protein PCURB6_27200 [Paenibacillus curdlanolyticus]